MEGGGVNGKGIDTTFLHHFFNWLASLHFRPSIPSPTPVSLGVYDPGSNKNSALPWWGARLNGASMSSRFVSGVELKQRALVKANESANAWLD